MNVTPKTQGRNQNRLSENRSIVQVHESQNPAPHTPSALYAFLSSRQNTKEQEFTLEIMARKVLTWESIATQGWLERWTSFLWDSITFSSKWVQVNVCGMLTKGSVKPLQDKAMRWPTCQWKISTNWPLLFLHLSSPSSPTHLFSGRRLSVFPQFLGWKTTASSGFSLLQNNSSAECLTHHLRQGW